MFFWVPAAALLYKHASRLRFTCVLQCTLQKGCIGWVCEQSHATLNNAF